MSDSHLLASAMNCTCVRYTDLPHTSKLFADFTYHPDRIRSFYPHLPSDPGVYEAAAREMQFPPERRAALVAALRQPNGDSPQLDLLAREGTVAVVTRTTASSATSLRYTGASLGRSPWLKSSLSWSNCIAANGEGRCFLLMTTSSETRKTSSSYCPH